MKKGNDVILQITDNFDFPVIVRSIAERLEPIYNALNAVSKRVSGN
jgi:hypothetical protein